MKTKTKKFILLELATAYGLTQAQFEAEVVESMGIVGVERATETGGDAMQWDVVVGVSL